MEMQGTNLTSMSSTNLTSMSSTNLQSELTQVSKVKNQENIVPSEVIKTQPEYQYLDDKKRVGEVLTISEKVVYEAIEKANKAVQGPNTYCKFTVHKKTNEICVKIVNSETNEIIREIPSEKVLDMVAKMSEMAGIFVDEKR